MKYIFLFICFSIVMLPSRVNGQYGWKWAFTSQQNNRNWYEMHSQAIDTQGNIIMTARLGGGDSMTIQGVTLHAPSAAEQYLVITKTDSGGRLLWAQLGGPLNGQSVDVVCDDTGNIYIMGQHIGYFWIGSATLTTGTVDGFLAKLTPGGSVQWLRELDYWATEIHMNPHNQVVVFGTFVTSVTLDSITYSVCDSGRSIYFETFNSSGRLISIDGIDGGTCQNFIMSAEIAHDGSTYINARFMPIGWDTSTWHFYIGGEMLRAYSMSDLNSYLAKIDKYGRVAWVRQLPDSTYPLCMQTDEKDNVFVAGSFKSNQTIDTFSISSRGMLDMFVSKFSATGHPNWIRTAGGVFDDEATEIARDSCGTLWVGGGIGYKTFLVGPDSEYEMHFDSYILHPLPHTGPYYFDPVFLARYDSLGNYVASIALASGGDDGIGLSTDATGNLYFGGDIWRSTCIFGNDTLLCPDTMSEYFVLAKYYYNNSPCHPPHPTAVPEVQRPTTLHLYPNPAQNTLTVEATEAIRKIIIANLLGQVVYEAFNLPSSIQLDISTFSAGIYIVKINDTSFGRLVKD